MTTMRAILYTARGAATATSIPLPELESGHAIIRVQAAGLCHTDIDVLHGRYGAGHFPLVPGHEYAGVVERVAEDVTSVKPGDRVAVDPNLSCGSCPSCRRGLTNLCRNLGAYGVTRAGGFAEFSAVKVTHLHKIGTLPFDVAALAEPLACVLNGLTSAGLEVGATGTQNALVVGAGPIGLLLALSLKARGVDLATVADINESRLQFARSLGLEAVVSGSSELNTRRHSFDFVADATGVARVVEGMVNFTADGGTMLVFGVSAPDAKISLAPFEIFRRQLKLVGSHSLNRNIPQALETLTADVAGSGAMAQLVSHRLPLDEILPFLNKGPSSGATMKVQYTATS